MEQEQDPEMYTRMKTAFYVKMDELIKAKNANNQTLTYEAYQNMIAAVERAKSLKFGKTPTDYARLKKYDILVINGEKRLVVPFFCSTNSSDSPTSGSIRMFVYTTEIFDLLNAAHLKHGHKRRMGMQQHVSQFKNITREMIKVYLDICEICNERMVSKLQVRDPKTSCIDFIGMPQDDAGYNLILIHLDIKTQFVQLRPLKNTEVTDVTRSLLDIFCIFGPPNVLQGNVDKEFGDKIVDDLDSCWADFKVTFMKTEEKLDILEVSRLKITELLNTWMELNRTLPWSEGVKYVQYMKNRQYNKDLGRSAGEAMFGNRFGRTIQGKKTSEGADNSNLEEEESTEPSSSDLTLQEETDVAVKRIKVEPSDKIVIQKIETLSEN